MPDPRRQIAAKRLLPLATSDDSSDNVSVYVVPTATVLRRLTEGPFQPNVKTRKGSCVNVAHTHSGNSSCVALSRLNSVI